MIQRRRESDSGEGGRNQEKHTDKVCTSVDMLSAFEEEGLREGTKQDAGGRHEDDKRMTRGTDNFSGESYLEEDSGKKRGTWVSTKKVLGFEDLSSCSCFDYTTAFQLNTIELNR